MASPTPNRNLTYPAHAGAINAWDSPLNADFDNLDLGFGGNYPISILSSVAGATYNTSYAAISSTVATITLPTSLALNMRYPVTGTLTRNVQIVFPAVGGMYNIANGSSGSFTVQAITAAGGSSGPLVSQGKRMWVTADGTNVYQADNNQVATIYTQLGTPTGSVAGTAGATSGSATDLVWDATNRVEYAATTTGTTATTVWSPVGPNYVAPQGYLTPTTGVPIILADVTSANLFYAPFKGNWVVVASGAATYPAQFSQLTLGLGALGATNIYDVFINNSSVGLILGTGPSWTVGGGSITAGSGARGTGAGSTQLSYLNGILVNTVAMTLTNGTSATYAISSGNGVYLGSVYTSSAGTVTCHRTYGQNRVWGVFNAYNREPVYLKGGDATASWTYNSTNTRVSNNSTGNSLVVFSGLAEEYYTYGFSQNVQVSADAEQQVGIGINSTNTFSGQAGLSGIQNAGLTIQANPTANFTTIPSLGINVSYSLESTPIFTGAGPAAVYVGTERNMLLSARWRA